VRSRFSTDCFYLGIHRRDRGVHGGRDLTDRSGDSLCRAHIAVAFAFFARIALHRFDLVGAIGLARTCIILHVVRSAVVEMRIEGEFDRLAHQ